MWSCVNENCPKFNQSIELLAMDAFIRGSIYLTKQEQKEYMTCSECGGKIDFIMPEKYKNNDIPNIAKFDSLSDVDKKKVIAKRYKEAMKKEGGYEKVQARKQARINLMRGE